MKQTKDNRVSDTDRKLGVKLISCQNCDMEFHTLHREDKYCAFCETYEGFKNPDHKKKRKKK